MFDASGMVELEDKDREELSRDDESDESEGVDEDGSAEGKSQTDEDCSSVAGIECWSCSADAGKRAVGELETGDPVESVVVGRDPPESWRSARDVFDFMG